MVQRAPATETEHYAMLSIDGLQECPAPILAPLKRKLNVTSSVCHGVIDPHRGGSSGRPASRGGRPGPRCAATARAAAQRWQTPGWQSASPGRGAPAWSAHLSGHPLRQPQHHCLRGMQHLQPCTRGPNCCSCAIAFSTRLPVLRPSPPPAPVSMPAREAAHPVLHRRPKL